MTNPVMRRGGLGGGLERHPHQDTRMVTQVLADAGDMLYHVDPQRTQRGCGSDP